MKVLDSLIIGTSPIAIVEAVYLRSKNKLVLNVDERKEVGGAWTTINHEGFPEVESGCHIWSYDKGTYKLISDLLDVQLIELNPQPYILYKKRMILYDWKSNVIAFQKIIKNIKSLRKTLTAPDVRFSLFPSKYLYPSGGSLELKKALEKIILEKALDVRLSTEVDKVVLTKNSVELFNVKDELVVVTNELVLTSLSKVSSITLDSGELIIPNTRKIDYIHVHLIIENVSNRLFSYIRTNGNDVIHRISDMTFQVKGQLEDNQVLFCVGIFPQPFSEKSETDLKIYIQKFLLENKLISEESKIINYTTNIYPSYYNESSFIDDVKVKTKGKIRFLRSTDFVYSFYNQKDRYKELLFSNSK